MLEFINLLKEAKTLFELAVITVLAGVALMIVNVLTQALVDWLRRGGRAAIRSKRT